MTAVLQRRSKERVSGQGSFRAALEAPRARSLSRSFLARHRALLMADPPA